MLRVAGSDALAVISLLLLMLMSSALLYTVEKYLHMQFYQLYTSTQVCLQRCHS